MKGMLLALLAATFQPTPTDASGDGRIFSTQGYVVESGTEDGGWFGFGGGNPQRFRLPAGEAETDMRVLVAAAERGVAIRVRYDGAAGRLGPNGTSIVYPLCSLSVANGAHFGDEGRNCPPADREDTPERALALGFATMGERPAEARRLFSRVLDVPALRALALEGRGDASVRLVANLPVGSAAYDRGYADALADFRAWMSLVPDSVEARRGVAEALEYLGGYEEALAIQRDIGRRWPDQANRVMRATVNLLQHQGLYAEALRVLDEYAAQKGPQDGMPFHYHRAWTLVLLNRPREALDEINLGLPFQPDYPYAIIVRACANAKLGRIDDALQDERRAAEILAGWAADDGSFAAGDLMTVRGAVAALEQLAAAHSRRASEIPCRGIWDRDIVRRPRSPLLDAPSR
jgi:tetratricopeptide (TPR) repeat protein